MIHNYVVLLFCLTYDCNKHSGTFLKWHQLCNCKYTAILLLDFMVLSFSVRVLKSSDQKCGDGQFSIHVYMIVIVK